MPPLTAIQITYYIAYAVGMFLLVGFIARYHWTTGGAWLQHKTGIGYMGDAVSMVLIFAALVLRILATRVFHWAWADIPTQVFALVGTFLVLGWIGFRWYLLEHYQKSDKE